MSDNNNKVNIDLSKLDYLHCPECSALTFTKVWWLKKIPRLMVGAPVDQVVSIEVHQCTECGHIIAPDQLKP